VDGGARTPAIEVSPEAFFECFLEMLFPNIFPDIFMESCFGASVQCSTDRLKFETVLFWNVTDRVTKREHRFLVVNQV
jgi:hypothetical protein